MAKLRLLLTAAGAAVLVWMLHRVGFAAIGENLRLVGWGWPLVLLPYFLVNLLSALAWKATIHPYPARLSLWRLFFYRLAGEAVNTTTPTAGVGGEPLKALLLEKHGVPLTAASASVVITKGVQALGLVIYACLGLALAPFLLTLPADWLVGLLLGALGLGLACIFFVLVQERGLGRLGVSLLRRLRLLPRVLQEKEEAIERFDARMQAFYREKRRYFYGALGLNVLAWLCHGLEVYAIFFLLARPLKLISSWCLDSLSMLIAGLAFMIPANLGVQDGGIILLALGFQLGALLGATVSVIRRLREVFWALVGLAALAWVK